MTTLKARCPLCHRVVVAIDHDRLEFIPHAAGPGRWPRHTLEVCEGSGWLVEDDELVGETA